MSLRRVSTFKERKRPTLHAVLRLILIQSPTAAPIPPPGLAPCCFALTSATGILGSICKLCQHNHYGFSSDHRDRNMMIVFGIALLTGCRLAGAQVHGKFKNWYPYYGGVLDSILQGKCSPGVCNAVNCSAELEAYLATNTDIDATTKCYNGNCLLDPHVVLS